MEHHHYTDSTPLLGDTSRLTDPLAEDGYVFLRGVLPAQEVKRVRDRVLALAAVAGWLRPAEAVDEDLPEIDVRTMTRGDGATREAVRGEMWSLREFHALMHSPELLDVLEGLLGEPVFVHPRKVLRFVPPESSADSYVSGWHQDHPGVQGSARTLTVWTPLAPVTARSGGLAIVPASHRGGILPLRLSAGTIVGWEIDTTIQTVHSGPMGPGDVLIFTAHTVHGGSPNTGSSPRLSADCRYQPLRDPVCRDSIELDDGSWDEIYRTWPGRGVDDSLAHYWKALPLDVVDYDLRADTIREREVIDAGRNRDPLAARALQITAAHSADPMIAAEAAALLSSLGRTLPER
ncbi:phytanoyl-CoA dioxygenase family protein [Lentzea sp. NEAU-D13]|uniref:Phytanoyl-CoA dioxygenase family protein n=1 Tax=Lentzea alba TaxID=2714351 RepID=A0A7C9VTC3_9PSEU|nr:phytanoyl-CoA dioxygenase family protein [Lentzea alba]NGY62452.1 phytanoyl-CoA dioxygenase family protein [Lentzea alba]